MARVRWPVAIAQSASQLLTFVVTIPQTSHAPRVDARGNHTTSKNNVDDGKRNTSEPRCSPCPQAGTTASAGRWGLAPHRFRRPLRGDHRRGRSWTRETHHVAPSSPRLTIATDAARPRVTMGRLEQQCVSSTIHPLWRAVVGGRAPRPPPRAESGADATRTVPSPFLLHALHARCSPPSSRRRLPRPHSPLLHAVSAALVRAVSVG